MIVIQWEVIDGLLERLGQPQLTPLGGGVGGGELLCGRAQIQRRYWCCRIGTAGGKERDCLLEITIENDVKME